MDPGETAHDEPSHLELQCSQIQLLLCLALYGLMSFLCNAALVKSLIMPLDKACFYCYLR